MELAIVTAQDPLYDTLLAIHNRDKGTLVAFGSRLFLATWNPALYFAEVDAGKPDRHDPDGRWGVYKYLGDPDE